MASNLSPEQLAWLQQQQYQPASSGSGYQSPFGAQYLNQTAGNGDTYHTSYDTSGANAEGYNASYNPTGYLKDIVPGKSGVGDMQQIYDTYGKYIAEGKISPDTTLTQFMIGAGIMAAPFALTAMGAGGAAAGGAAGPGTGYADMWSGMPAGTVEGSYGAAGGAAGAAGSGAGAGSGILQGSSAGMTAPAGLGAATGAGTGIFGAGAGAALGGVGSLLGPAAAVLGGIAGSQPQTTNQTQTKDIPEWLKPSVMGLLGNTDALLQKQMAPGYLAGYDQMRTVGQGLLNQPIAGNGFGTFSPGRR